MVVLEYLAAGDPVEPGTPVHVAACAACGEHVRALTEASEAYRRSHPPERFLRKLEAREVAPPAWRRWLLGSAAASACAVLLTVLTLRGTDEVRLKGGTEFGVYVKRAGEAAPLRLASGAKVRAGEVLRFHYQPPGDGWLLLVSIDGTGQLTVFHPYQGTAAARVAGGTLSVLEESIALDEAPGPERLAAIFSPEPFTLEELRGWLRGPSSSAPRIDCPHCQVEWVVLEKSP
ncbi:ActD [Archangium gephyra]|uniref:ActD n=1 Tax=Archangium gephyra TaxID=48 RepID=A0AAC8QA11_9BACT|nr:ActD [Archangium gephyra]